MSLRRDVFAWAYERSCAQFTVQQEAMGDLTGVRADILARYSLRLSEFEAWAEAVAVNHQ